jgi:TetR/AcrR family transcriptional repressor of lmrAB and yxaGH operons
VAAVEGAVILAIASRSVHPLDDVGHHLGELARLHMP